MAAVIGNFRFGPGTIAGGGALQRLCAKTDGRYRGLPEGAEPSSARGYRLSGAGEPVGRASPETVADQACEPRTSRPHRGDDAGSDQRAASPREEAVFPVAQGDLVQAMSFTTPEQVFVRFNVSRESQAGLRLYADLLTRWQGKINLVGEESLTSLWARHIGDALQLRPLIGTGEQTIIDLGAGAG